MKKLTVLAAVCAIFANPLAAQERQLEQAVPEQSIAPGLSPGAIDAMCSERGAFQYAFGEQDVPTSSRLERSMRMSLALPETFAPFENMEPKATQWSRQLAMVDYTTREFDREVRFTEEDAAALAEQLAPMLERVGWSRYEDFDRGTVPMYRLAALGQHNWRKIIPTEDGETTIYFSIDTFATQLYITCAHDQLTYTLTSEGLGRIPEGTPRPAPPDLPFVPVPDFSTCMSNEYTGELDGFLESGRPTLFLGTLLARSNHRAMLSRWIEWRLEEGGIDSDVLFELMVDILELDSATSSTEAILVLPGSLEKLDEARQSENRADVCNALVELTAQMNRIEAASIAQTAEFERQANIHAERLGISLD